MNTSLVQPLFEGPIDVVGDVHGEIDALLALLRHLGYQDGGSHPNGRKLLFLGDLTDRGPDSPAVVKKVQQLVEAGRAQCVLGNHDLNILLGHRKFDNGWFFGEVFHHEGKLTPQVLADEETRNRILAFFRTLPLALLRDDLRVVHACWHADHLAVAREASDAVELCYQCQERIERGLAANGDLDAVDRKLREQNDNPVKVLTSGLERRAEKPFVASGEERFEERVPWWEEYDDVFCVFGHYSLKQETALGPGRAFCADFGVASRWSERLKPAFDGVFREMKLGALRFPEKVIVFDDGKFLDSI